MPWCQILLTTACWVQVSSLRRAACRAWQNDIRLGLLATVVSRLAYKLAHDHWLQDVPKGQLSCYKHKSGIRSVVNAAASRGDIRQYLSRLGLCIGRHYSDQVELYDEPQRKLCVTCRLSCRWTQSRSHRRWKYVCAIRVTWSRIWQLSLRRLTSRQDDRWTDHDDAVVVNM